MRGSIFVLIGRGLLPLFPGYDDIINDSIYRIGSRPDHCSVDVIPYTTEWEAITLNLINLLW